MKDYTTTVKSIQLERKILDIYKAIFDERIALSRDATRSMKSIELWRGNDSIRSRAMSIARLMKTYLDKPLVPMEKLVQKCGVGNAVEIAETTLNELRSVRVECKNTWNRLIASAMKQKVRSIRVIQKVLTIVQRAMKRFRAPRAHRSRRFRLAVASAGSGGDGGSDGPGEPPRLPGLTGFPLASGWSE